MTYVTDPDFCVVRPGGRDPSAVKWKGVSEKLTVEVEDSEVLFHRRIVFTYHGDLTDLPTRKIIVFNAADGECGRDMCYGWDDDLTRIVLGEVFTEPSLDCMMHGKVNTSNVRVAEDKLNQYGGRGGSSKVWTKKYWNRLPFTVKYDGKEPGTQFSRPSGVSPVKGCYVLDVFRHGLVGNRLVEPVKAADSKAPKREGMDVDSVPFPERKKPNKEAGAKARVMSDMKVYWYK